MKKPFLVFLKNFPDAAPAWSAPLVLCLTVLVSYINVWPNEFVFDDKLLIEQNGLLQHWRTLPQLLLGHNFAGSGLPGGVYRPIVMGLYLLIFQAFGASTVAFHALNISLHALNACLLNRLGVRAGFDKGPVFFAALLWAVHPLHTSAVTYMSVTPELLWTCFTLMGLLALLPDFTPRKILTALAFFLLALGSKESAVVFPALATTIFFFTGRVRPHFSAYLKMWPLWLLAAVYAVLRLWLAHISPAYNLDNGGNAAFFLAYKSNPLNRLLTSLATLPVYARLIFWPTGLHIERVFPVFFALLTPLPLAGAVMAGLGLLQILWGKMRRGLALSFGLLWFAAALSPYTGIVMPIDAILSEDWLYLPMTGLFLGLVQTAAGLFKEGETAAWLCAGLLATLLGAVTLSQNNVWRNPETLYQNILQNGGRIDRIGSHLGLYYTRRGEFDKAVKIFQYEIDHPDGRLPVLWVNPYLKLALAWLQAPLDENDTVTLDAVARALPSCQHIPEVIAALGQTLSYDPDFIWSHQALAVIYRYQGNNQMMAFHDRKVGEILQKQRAAASVK